MNIDKETSKFKCYMWKNICIYVCVHAHSAYEENQVNVKHKFQDSGYNWWGKHNVIEEGHTRGLKILISFISLFNSAIEI